MGHSVGRTPEEAQLEKYRRLPLGWSYNWRVKTCKEFKMIQKFRTCLDRTCLCFHLNCGLVRYLEERARAVKCQMKCNVWCLHNENNFSYPKAVMSPNILETFQVLFWKYQLSDHQCLKSQTGYQEILRKTQIINLHFHSLALSVGHVFPPQNSYSITKKKKKRKRKGNKRTW